MPAGLWSDKKYKLIPNPGCLHFFKSKAPDEDLKINVFVYLNMKTNKFMVARWISMNMFIAILELGLEPTLDDDIVDSYLQYCYPKSTRSNRAAMKEAHDNQIEQEEELEYEHRTSRAKILRDEFHVKVPDEDGCAHLPAALVGSENTCG